MASRVVLGVVLLGIAMLGMALILVAMEGRSEKVGVYLQVVITGKGVGKGEWSL